MNTETLKIPKNCTGVKCMQKNCTNQASHKVGEQNIWDSNDADEANLHKLFSMKHELTTYLCEHHFSALMNRDESYTAQLTPLTDAECEQLYDIEAVMQAMGYASALGSTDLQEQPKKAEQYIKTQLTPYKYNTQAKEEWVSVDDRMPELTEPLMGRDDNDQPEVIIENHYATVLAYNPQLGIYKAEYSKRGWVEKSSISSNGGHSATPTHWQPLPTPPKTIKK